VDELEHLWPDPDRREAALGRVAVRVGVGELRRQELDRKDRDVLQAISVGLSSIEAADVLGLPHGTVQDRLKACRRVLRAKNTTHAVALAIRQGFIR